MLSCPAVPRSLFRQGVSWLLRGGEGGGGFKGQVGKLQRISAGADGPAGVSLSSSSSCRLRGLGSRANEQGRKKNGGMNVEEEGLKQEAPMKKKKRKSVKTKALQISADESSGEEAAAVGGLSRDNGGGIHLIVGPMFAGKSTALLQRVQEEASVGRRVALVKSDKDTRYGLSAIVTHDGQQMPCYAVPDLASFKTRVGDKYYKELEVIGIDEAQFFTDLYEFCQSAADFEGKMVIVAGLDGDFLRRKFGSTLDLIPVADSIVKLTSRCDICGRPALFSFRKTLDTNPELVGGADVYMPVCRQHFVNGQIVVEAASTVIGAHQVAQMSKD